MVNLYNQFYGGGLPSNRGGSNLQSSIRIQLTLLASSFPSSFFSSFFIFLGGGEVDLGFDEDGSSFLFELGFSVKSDVSLDFLNRT
jgi:hypothetical protein